MPVENIEVFVSYRWEQPSSTIAEEVYHALSKEPYSFSVIKDDKTLGYKGEIGAFMERIGDGKFVVVVLCDGYLRSRHCMNELVQLKQNTDFQKRIFPIVMGDAAIHDELGRIRYKRHWENKKAELQAAYNELSDKSHSQSTIDELSLFDDIQDSVLKIATIIGDMNTLSASALQSGGYAEIAKAILAEATRLEANKTKVVAHEVQAAAGARGLKETFKYAVDRSAQLAAVMKGRKLSNHEPPRFFFVYGEQSESHEGLGQRIKLELEGEFLLNTHRDLRCTLNVLEYPEAVDLDWDVDQLLTLIYDQYKVNADQFAPVKEQKFGRMLKQSAATNPFRKQDLILLQILVNDFDLVQPHVPQVVEWINNHYFDREPFLAAEYAEDAPEVVVLWSVMATSAVRDQEAVRNCLKAMTAAHGDWQMMPELKSIEMQHLIKWLQLYHPNLTAEEQDTWIQQYFGAKLPMKMDQVERILETLIKNTTR